MISTVTRPSTQRGNTFALHAHKSQMQSCARVRTHANTHLFDCLQTGNDVLLCKFPVRLHFPQQTKRVHQKCAEWKSKTADLKVHQQQAENVKLNNETVKSEEFCQTWAQNRNGDKNASIIFYISKRLTCLTYTRPAGYSSTLSLQETPPTQTSLKI